MHGLGRIAHLRAGFDFHESHNAPAPHDQIDLALWRAVAHGKQAVAFEHKPEGCYIFRPTPSAFALLPAMAHAVHAPVSASARW